MVSGKSDAYKALSIKVRRKILDLLMTCGPLDLEECSKIIGIKPITVRHHIRILEQAGLIESFTLGREAPGRPRRYYKVIKRFVNLGFPVRRFDLLSQQALSALISKTDAKEAERLLKVEAERLGREMLKDLTIKHEVKTWNLENLKKFIIPVLEQMGSYPSIKENSDKTLNLNFFNCIFYEVSKRFHPLICCVHEAFLKPMMEAAGYVKESHDSYLVKDADYCSIKFKLKS